LTRLEFITDTGRIRCGVIGITQKIGELCLWAGRACDLGALLLVPSLQNSKTSREKLIHYRLKDSMTFYFEAYLVTKMAAYKLYTLVHCKNIIALGIYLKPPVGLLRPHESFSEAKPTISKEKAKSSPLYHSLSW